MDIARLVVKDQFGQLEIDRNEPLKFVTDGDAWLITGSNSQEFNAKNQPDPPWSGPLRMRISRFDGQILSYVFDLDWQKAATAANPDATK